MSGRPAVVLALMLGCLSVANAQELRNPSEVPCDAGPANTATPLHRDERCSSMLLCIPHEVPAHLHRHHTEHVTILEGRAELLLGSDTIQVAPGDVIAVPAGTPHGVLRTIAGPLKVLSVHAPPFDGKDRIPWNP